jgi:hypothetical protein
MLKECNLLCFGCACDLLVTSALLRMPCRDGRRIRRRRTWACSEGEHGIGSIALRSCSGGSYRQTDLVQGSISAIKVIMMSIGMET